MHPHILLLGNTRLLDEHTKLPFLMAAASPAVDMDEFLSRWAPASSLRLPGPPAGREPGLPVVCSRQPLASPDVRRPSPCLGQRPAPTSINSQGLAEHALYRHMWSGQASGSLMQSLQLPAPPSVVGSGHFLIKSLTRSQESSAVPVFCPNRGHQPDFGPDFGSTRNSEASSANLTSESSRSSQAEVRYRAYGFRIIFGQTRIVLRLFGQIRTSTRSVVVSRVRVQYDEYAVRCRTNGTRTMSTRSDIVRVRVRGQITYKYAVRLRTSRRSNRAPVRVRVSDLPNVTISTSTHICM